jgi:hypothetical protein
LIVAQPRKSDRDPVGPLVIEPLFADRSAERMLPRGARNDHIGIREHHVRHERQKVERAEGRAKLDSEMP